jgi:hypothetical protein
MKLVIGILLLLLAIQVVPYGRAHENPPVVAEPMWDAPATRAVARRACFDCHSNQTVWPAYSRVAPASWLVQHDVEEGRETMNFSEWNRPQTHADDAAQEVLEKKMPPAAYLLMHPEARLSDAEREQLARSLSRMFTP